MAVTAVLAAMVLVVLNTTMTTAALPALAKALQAAPASAIWVLTAYQAALLMALMPCAALGESLGYRRVFTAGVWLFTGTSLLCALAPTLPWLVAARFVQGLGGAAIMALGVALLRSVVAQHQLGTAIGWNTLTVALSSAAGPVIGATLLALASWPWLFAVHLPLGLGVLLAVRALPQIKGSSHPLRLTSMLLNAGVFAALISAAGCLPKRLVLASVLVAGSAVQLWWLVGREGREAAPLIPLDLLAARAFRLSVIASVLCFAGQTAGMVALPFFLQRAFGLGNLQIGLYLMLWPLTVACMAPFAGRLADRLATARLCVVGGICMGAGLSAASQLPAMGLTPIVLVPLVMLCGMGFSLFNVANNRAMFLSTPMARSGAAGGIQGTARLLGQTAGGVIITLTLEVFASSLALRVGLGIGAVLTFLSAGCCLLQDRQRP